MKHFGIASASIVTLKRILENHLSHADHENVRESTLVHYHGDERRYYYIDDPLYKQVK